MLFTGFFSTCLFFQVTSPKREPVSPKREPISPKKEALEDIFMDHVSPTQPGTSARGEHVSPTKPGTSARGRKRKGTPSPSKQDGSPKKAKTAYSLFKADQIKLTEADNSTAKQFSKLLWQQVRNSSRPRTQSGRSKTAESSSPQLKTATKITDFFKKM